MMKSTRSKVNVVEFISLRIGFTLYTGWVTAATILNVSFFLKSVGMKEGSAGFSESVWTCVILWVAFVIYCTATIVERNPLFGCVYFWVVSAIRDKQIEDENIKLNTMIILIVLAVYMTLVTSFMIYEKCKGKCNRGLLYF